jgi:signal transduction histidine kinase
VLPFYTLQVSLRRFYLCLFTKSPVSLQGVIDRLVEAVLVLDQEDRIVCLNLAALGLMDDLQDRVLGRPLRLVLPGLTVPTVPGQSYPIELRHQKSGLPVLFEANFSPYVDPISGFTGRLLILQAVSSKNELSRLALAAQLQEASEFEQRRIAAELHDRVGQNLTGLNLGLKRLQSYCYGENNGLADDLFMDCLALVEETTRQVRALMTELIPPMLDEYGLVAALHWYGAQYTLRTRIPVQVLGDEFAPRLAHHVELATFRIVQEALNNVAKHAQASQVTIRLVADGDCRCIRIEDNGQGADPGISTPSSERAHWGLMTMHDRAASIGGILTITSQPGQGTCVGITYTGKNA